MISVGKTARWDDDQQRSVDDVSMPPQSPWNTVMTVIDVSCCCIGHVCFSVIMKHAKRKEIVIINLVDLLSGVIQGSVLVWFPYRKGDILAIENVQRRFTKRIPGFLRVVIESVCHCLNSLVWSYVGLDLIFLDYLEFVWLQILFLF